MTYIRVDVEELRQKANELEFAAERMQALADEVYAAAAGAPSYGGQFRPRVLGLADEARAVLVGRAQRLRELSNELNARAEAFEAIDEEWREALAGINRRSQYPLTDIQFGQTDGDQEPPWWLVELIIGLVPFGDLYDIVKELIRLITSGETDTLILILAVIGLALDAGHADGPIPDPVDAANAAAALLKGLVRQIPPGAARDAIQEILLRKLRNLHEAPEFFATLHTLIKNGEILEVLKDNPRALAAILDSGPELVEQLAKNEEVALALLRHGEDAVPLLKNADAVEVLGRYGPDAVEKVIRYGDEGLDLIAEHGRPMIDFLARTPDELGELATRTIESFDAADELARIGLGSPRSAELIETIARNSTHGTGDRLVLGRWVDPEDWAEMGGGYAGDAFARGGIYYETPPGLYGRLKDTGDAAWQTNAQALRYQMELGIERIDFVSGDVLEWIDLFPDNASSKEIRILLNESASYGYSRVGNSWVLKTIDP